MFTRCIALAVVCFGAATTQAQLPSDRFSPINYFARYHGFGYSDGYHACKDANCKPSPKWWEPMSTFYGAPSSPPANSFVRQRQPGMHQGFHPPIGAPRMEVPYASTMPEAPYVAPSPMQAPAMAPPAHSTPLPMVSPTPLQSPAPPSIQVSPAPPPSLYESVPAAPRVPQSPSDRVPSSDPYQLPAPLPTPNTPRDSDELVPNPLNTRRLPPGSYSLSRGGNFGPRR